MSRKDQTPRAFTPIRIRSLELRNRIVMAPMTRRKAEDDGIPTEAIVDYYRRRAAGEVGLIVSEGTAIDDRHAYDTLSVPRFHAPEQHHAWRRVVDAVHAEGGAFAPQLWHTGRLAANPIGPSAAELPPRKDGTPRPKVRAMADADFAQVLTAYAVAARAAADMGCDAVEIHGAHGYLLDSFLSPASNQRRDGYGGSAQNRMRLPLEVVDAVRSAVGPDLPVIYRFSQWNMDDYRETKWRTPQDLAPWVTALRDHGVDVLHVSTRAATDPAFAEDPDHPSWSLATWTQHLSGLPTIAVGKVSVTLAMDESYGADESQITDPGPALDLVERGEVEMLAVGRALIANPDWVRLVREGRWRELRPYHKDLLVTLE
jgi:2,4-dienoyl-CoA reductase-like NADH-dependent reductase (Old Yellow Enzyme family)